MAKTKKISTNKMDKVIEFYGDKVGTSTTLTLNVSKEETVDVEVKTFLPFDEYAELVSNIAIGCFQYVNGRLEYFASKRDFIIRANIIDAYTNIKTNVNQAKLYHMAYSPIYNKIVDKIDNIQYCSVISSVNEQIKYIQDTSISNRNEEIDNKLRELDEIINRFGAFENIDMTNIESLVNKLNGISEEDIVNTLKSEFVDKE